MRRSIAPVVLSVWMLAVMASEGFGQSVDSVTSRLRPIDAPSAVDRYRGRSVTGRPRETVFEVNSAAATRRPADAEVRQTVFWQSPGFTAPALPPGQGGFAFPSDGAPATTPAPVSPPPQMSSPGSTLPSATNLPAPPQRVPSSSSDLAPLAAPSLDSGFATIGNCCCISGPSTYVAASGVDCGSPLTYAVPDQTFVAPPTFMPPPAEIAAPAILPPLGANSAAPIRPLVSFGQQRNVVQLGQGLIGQPVAYVPGQPVRNWLRYMFP